MCTACIVIQRHSHPLIVSLGFSGLTQPTDAGFEEAKMLNMGSAWLQGLVMAMSTLPCSLPTPLLSSLLR